MFVVVVVVVVCPQVLLLSCAVTELVTLPEGPTIKSPAPDYQLKDYDFIFLSKSLSC